MNNNQLAEVLDSAAKNAHPVPQVSLSNPINLDSAYEIQRLSINKRLDRGEQLIGLKMGFTSKAKMEQMGVHDLIWGRLTDNMLYNSGDVLKISDYIHPRAEPEIAFRISQDINKELSLDEVKSYVDGVALAIEIIDSRYENFKFSLEDVVADNCSSAGLVIGAWSPPDIDISNILMSLVIDDVIVGKGTSKAILGNPWASLVAATRLAITNGEPIKKGHVVLAGAATSAQYIKPNTTVSAYADGLSSVFLDIE